MQELKIGDQAPIFSAPNENNEIINLQELKDKKKIIYFYPKDDTPGCTIEAQDFNKLREDFLAKNTIILGISKDSIKSHIKFKEKYNLAFTLISDENIEICKNYGVWVEKSMYGRKYMGIDRSSFLIDENNKILKIWRNVKVKNHAQEVLESI
jgi:peroxiredoxin Q/BCP